MYYVGWMYYTDDGLSEFARTGSKDSAIPYPMLFQDHSVAEDLLIS